MKSIFTDRSRRGVEERQLHKGETVFPPRGRCRPPIARDLPPSDTFPRVRAWPLAAAALLAATVASYAPVFDAGFVNYDDMAYVAAQRARVRRPEAGRACAGRSPATRRRTGTRSRGSAAWSTVEIFGLDPRGPTSSNLVLHVLNVALLFGVLRSLTGNAACRASRVAALFALHPRTSSRSRGSRSGKTLLCTLFVLLSIGAYARGCAAAALRRYAREPRPLRPRDGFEADDRDIAVRAAAPRLVAAAPPGVCRSRRPRVARGARERLLRLVPEKLPFFRARRPARGDDHARRAARRDVADGNVRDLASRPRQRGDLVRRYLGIFVRLARNRLGDLLSALAPSSQTAAQIRAAAALLAVITAAAIWSGRRRGHLLFGWLWYLRHARAR